MIKKGYIIMGIFLFMNGGIVQSQDFSKDWTAYMQAFSKAKNLHMVMEVKAWESQNSQWVAGGERTITLYKQGDNIYHTFTEMEMLKTNKLILMINHKNKQIIKNKPQKEVIHGQIELPLGIDSLLKQQQNSHTIAFLGTKQGINEYQITFKQGSTKYIRIYFDKKTNYLSSLEYLVYSALHETDIKSVIKVSVFNINASVPSNYFEEKTYITKVNGKWQATNKYKNYQIINIGNEN